MKTDFYNRKSRAAGLQRHLAYRMSKAVRTYNMLEDGDRVLVCHSGGKDSFVMLDILNEFKKKTPLRLSISVLCLDINLPGFPGDELADYYKESGTMFNLVKQDIYGTVKEKIPDDKNMCGLCSRLRRGAIYRFAEENDIDKIALGHHMDDIVETLFLNIFYGGKIKAMPPKLLTADKKNVVIRPMAFIDESDIIKYAKLKSFPVVPGDLCGAEKNMKRKTIKEMLADWKKRYPGRVETVFNSIGSVAPSQLADQSLYDFSSLKRDKG